MWRSYWCITRTSSCTWNGKDTRNKIASAVDDFCKKHDIKLNRRDAEDFVENIKDAVDNEMA